MKLCSLAVALALGSAAQAQFAFDAENTDPALLFNDIKALWSNWAAIGNQVLASARAQYPDAYAQLTSVYGTTHLPAQFDAVPARNAAQALARSAAQLTVWDKNAGDRAQYSFEVRDVQVGAPAALVSVLAALAATHVLAQEVTVSGGAGAATASSAPDDSAAGGIGDASSEQFAGASSDAGSAAAGASPAESPAASAASPSDSAAAGAGASESPAASSDAAASDSAGSGAESAGSAAGDEQSGSQTSTEFSGTETDSESGSSGSSDSESSGSGTSGAPNAAAYPAAAAAMAVVAAMLF
ncbi:hypothetical protein LPJ63_004173 [Coemansia sp. RSA 2711]|nr:hypothetical protein LPJ63_004173 [Coemansia sp. RSA 2711]